MARNGEVIEVDGMKIVVCNCAVMHYPGSTIILPAWMRWQCAYPLCPSGRKPEPEYEPIVGEPRFFDLVPPRGFDERVRPRQPTLLDRVQQGKTVHQALQEMIIELWDDNWTRGRYVPSSDHS